MGWAEPWLGCGCWVQAETWGKWKRMGRDASGLENPHLVVILVPHSNFCGCLCL